jgi:hypothetical protein
MGGNTQSLKSKFLFQIELNNATYSLFERMKLSVGLGAQRGFPILKLEEKRERVRHMLYLSCMRPSNIFLASTVGAGMTQVTP